MLFRSLTLSDPMDCSLPGSSVHGIFQARVLEWGAIAFSKSFSSSRLIWQVYVCGKYPFYLDILPPQHTPLPSQHLLPCGLKSCSGLSQREGEGRAEAKSMSWLRGTLSLNPTCQPWKEIAGRSEASLRAVEGNTEF